MASAEALTHAGLDVMRSGAEKNPQGVTVQVMSVVVIPGSQRMKLQITDGTDKTDATLAGDFYQLFSSGQLKEFSLLHVQKWMAQTVDGKTKYVLNSVAVTGNPGRSLGPDTPAPPAKKAKYDTSPPGGASGISPPSIGKAMAGNRRIQPLNALNPYMGSWTVRVRAGNKGNLRSVKTKNGDKSVFSVDFTDEQGTSIQATAWGDAANKFFNGVEEGKVYYVSNGSLRPANRQYNTTNNDYEMSLNERSVIEEAEDVTEMQIDVKFEFMPIDRLATRVGARAPVDVIGIVTECGEIGQVTRKTDGTQLTKREVTILDQTARTVRVTLWGTLAENEGQQIASSDGAVVAFKNLRVGDYNGVSLTTLGRSVVLVNPENMPEADKLRQWYANGGSSAPTVEAGAGLANAAGAKGEGGNGRKTLVDMQPEQLAPVDAKPEWGTTHCTILYIRSENPYYTACPSGKCNKKVTDDGNGNWRCEACQQSFDHCQRRYTLSLKAADTSGSCWINAFNDQAAQIFGMSADELHARRECNDGSFEKTVQQALWKPFVMKLKSKTEVYKEEANRRITAVSLAKPDYAAESKALLQAIKGSA